MKLYEKTKDNFDNVLFVKHDNVEYYPDYMISLTETSTDLINLNNCICVFLVLNSSFGNYEIVGAKHFENLDNENILELINGYLPSRVYCYTETIFPLESFLASKKFK